MRKYLLPILLLILVAGFSACAPQESVPPSQSSATPAVTPLAQKVLATPAFPNDQAALAFGNNAFAFDLYQALLNGGGNVFYSPYSISTALAMAYAGARAETASQMASTLRFGLTEERVHSSFSALSQELSQRGTPPKSVPGFHLDVANALWGQVDYPFLPAYLDLVRQYYGGALKSLDFVKATEAARLEINRWGEENTGGRVKELLAPGVINPAVRLVLTNAIYFYARWEHEFNEKNTAGGDFHLLDGSAVSVPMMKQTRQTYHYFAGENYQAISLPYQGDELAMVILLPAEGQFAKFESALHIDKLNDILARMQKQTPEVNLTLPKFKFESLYALRSTLSRLGMPTAFSGNADFSGMTGRKGLLISDVVHKTFVSVDEQGTEAAGITAVIMMGAAPPAPPVEFDANRPFIFMIRDVKTGAILFLGRVLDPSR